MPSIAKRAHEERIDFVVEESLKKFSISNFQISMKKINYISVTQGPGLAVALEVGIKKAKALALKYNKKLIAVNHLEGHIYSAFAQNSQGNPKRDFEFPYLALIISGGHTEFVIFKNHLEYEVIGSTLDDAAGEALDKAAKLLGLGYPGGPVLERLAKEVNNIDSHNFPRPMLKSKDLNFSFSGLKTSFYYFLKSNNRVIPAPIRGQAPAGIQLNGSPIKSGMTKELKYDLRQLASSFQEAVFDTLIKKTEMAIKKTGINRLIIGGGVIANSRLRNLMRALVKKYQGEVLFPSYKYLTGDNAAMIGIVAGYKAKKDLFVEDMDEVDRIPRMEL